LQAFLLNQAAVDTIAPFIQGSPDEIQQRLAVYYDAYRWRMIEILQVAYPKLAIFLGQEPFADLALAYIADYPSEHVSARYIGEHLASFLASHQRPILAELAHFEWLLGDVLDAADSAILTAESLQAISVEDWPDLRLGLRASVRIIALHHPVPQLWQQLAEGVAISPAIEPAALPVDWVIWRYEQTAYFASLDAPSLRMFQLLAQGLPFAALCEQLETDLPSEDIPQFSVGFLQHWVGQQCLQNLG